MKSHVADLLLSKDEELHKMAEQKVNSGFGIPLDLARVDALTEKDRFKKIEAKSNYEKTIRELRDLIPGLPTNVRVDDLKYNALPIDEIERLAKKIENRPELKVAEMSVEAMRLVKKSADNEVSPVIQGYAEVGTLGSQPLGLVNSPTGSIGIQVTIPLYSGGLHEGRAAEALSKLNSIEWQDQQIKLETQNRLETSRTQLKYTSQVVHSTMRQVEMAKKASGLAEQKVKIGSAGNLELLNAQSDFATALEMNVQALFAHEAAKLQFFHLISDLEGYFVSNDTGGSNE